MVGRPVGFESSLWFEPVSTSIVWRFTEAMKKYEYHRGNLDHTAFIKCRDGKFKMKDLGALKYFLGIKVTRSATSICLSQMKYVLDILIESAICPNQVPTNKKIYIYQRLVEKLIYLSHTRPDIAYAISVVSEFMHSPSKYHLAAFMRILSYWKKAPARDLILRKLGILMSRVTSLSFGVIWLHGSVRSRISWLDLHLKRKKRSGGRRDENQIRNQLPDSGMELLAAHGAAKVSAYVTHMVCFLNAYRSGSLTRMLPPEEHRVADSQLLTSRLGCRH
ncbi:cyclin-dependent kinase B1 [Prunus dulcis]|uniref:Cyclin-dependent kinase B1 n=1 Tax=Prunus dulcis TaxID=3755 RepID=A0A4Y1RUX7_PRUDU|nr:cyclin-dependent kinase B1 [Prunus dulcis]